MTKFYKISVTVKATSEVEAAVGRHLKGVAAGAGRMRNLHALTGVLSTEDNVVDIEAVAVDLTEHDHKV